MNRETEDDKDIFRIFKVEGFNFLVERSIPKISRLKSIRDGLDIRVNKIKRKN